MTLGTLIFKALITMMDSVQFTFLFLYFSKVDEGRFYESAWSTLIRPNHQEYYLTFQRKYNFYFMLFLSPRCCKPSCMDHWSIQSENRVLLKEALTIFQGCWGCYRHTGIQKAIINVSPGTSLIACPDCKMGQESIYYLVKSSFGWLLMFLRS